MEVVGATKLVAPSRLRSLLTTARGTAAGLSVKSKTVKTRPAGLTAPSTEVEHVAGTRVAASGPFIPTSTARIMEVTGGASIPDVTFRPGDEEFARHT